MVVHITSVDTQSIRLRLKPSLPELGWKYPTPIVSGFAFPCSTWEDNCALVAAETPRLIESGEGGLIAGEPSEHPHPDRHRQPVAHRSP
ncbi:MAG: hypothetical protein ACI8RZ_007585 [Myxococcota bacterium]|jgi:hypothetical protein